MRPARRPLSISMLPALGLLLALGSCASGGGLGRVPDDVVDLYDLASPDGVIEIEIDRDGSIREMEAEVPLESVPASILDAARQRHPDAQVTGAERELTKDGEGWEVKLRHMGRELELVYDEGGNLLEFERSIDRSEAPQAVLQAAQDAVPGGSMRSVEIVEQHEMQLYHVKFDKGGASYKVILTPEGEVTRKVREQRAEIEIPLAM